MDQYTDNLCDAIEDARNNSPEKGLSANHYRGSHTWEVGFFVDHSMTIISTEDERSKTNEQIARMIKDCWDPEWSDA